MIPALIPFPADPMGFSLVSRAALDLPRPLPDAATPDPSQGWLGRLAKRQAARAARRDHRSTR